STPQQPQPLNNLNLIMQQLAPPSAPTFRAALAFWLRLGFISFGGPAGQIAIMHDFLVDKKRWISNSKFLHALNYCMLLPGPEAQQLATYTGWMLHGVRGGLAAGILFVLPSAFILWGLSVLYVTYGQIAAVQAVFDFLKPAVVAVVAGAIVKIGKKSLHTPLHFVVAAVAFIAIYLLNVPFPAIILGAILLGAVLTFTKLQKFSKRAVETTDDVTESSYVINRDTVLPGSGFSTGRLIRQIAIAALLWVLPFALFLIAASNFDFWKKLSLFFTQAAFVTFGGAYAVLPYVAQVSVEKFFWLTKLQMLDGLALGETTPGPLIMVLAFVGFMAGYNTFGGSLAAATAGLAATVFYTFLPSFLFIFAGAPLIERTHANPAVKSILNFATAAVTGVILSLCLYLGQAVIMPDPPQVLWMPLIWIVVSLAALQHFKVGLMTWIGVSVAAGLIKYTVF
ncbi:MAG TPA: chromate efflux transporter, partial [Saprospiraceae bacterium]|nr:chromate efflux transporter [Saprospiraceae bacterium]